MKKFIISVLTFLFPVSLALAQAPIYINVPGVGNRPVQGVVDGTAYMTDRFPDASKTVNFTLFSGTVVAGASTSLTTFSPFPSASMYSHKILRVAISGLASAAVPWNIKFIGSTDGINYAWLMNRYYGVGEVAQDMTNAERNAAMRDTLTIRGYGNTVGTLVTAGSLYELNSKLGEFINLPYIAAIFDHDSTAGGTATVTLELQARQK